MRCSKNRARNGESADSILSLHRPIKAAIVRVALLIAFGMTALAAATLVGRAQEIEVAFFHLQSAVAGLGGLVGVGADYVAQVKDLRRRINRLQDIVQGADTKNLGIYALVLEHHADLLRQAASLTNPVEAIAIISDVSADLDLKIASSASLGAGPAFRGVIEVTVRTKRDCKEIGGYLIRANPIRWKDSDPRFSFPVLSSPSTHQIPPGIYEVVAIRSGQMPARRTADIGLAGEDKVSVDIPVP